MFVHVVGKGHTCTQPLSLQDLQESSSISAASHSQLTHRKLKMLGFSTGNPCPILLRVCDFFSATSMLSVGGWKGKQGTSNQIWENIPQRQFEEFVKRSRTKFRKRTHSRGKDWRLSKKKEEECLRWLGLFVSLMNVCVFSWIFAHRVSPRCCEPVVKACLFFLFMVTSSERKNKHKEKEWMNEWNIVYNMGQKPTVRQCKRLANIFTNA